MQGQVSVKYDALIKGLLTSRNLQSKNRVTALSKQIVSLNRITVEPTLLAIPSLIKQPVAGP